MLAIISNNKWKNIQNLSYITLFKISLVHKSTKSWKESMIIFNFLKKRVICSISFRPISLIKKVLCNFSEKSSVISLSSSHQWKILLTVYLLHITLKETIFFVMMMLLTIENMLLVIILKIFHRDNLCYMIRRQLLLLKKSKLRKIFWSYLKSATYLIIRLQLQNKMEEKQLQDGWIKKVGEQLDLQK